MIYCRGKKYEQQSTYGNDKKLLTKRTKTHTEKAEVFMEKTSTLRKNKVPTRTRKHL